jgi:hypothetical protein
MALWMAYVERMPNNQNKASAIRVPDANIPVSPDTQKALIVKLLGALQPVLFLEMDVFQEDDYKEELLDALILAGFNSEFIFINYYSKPI